MESDQSSDQALTFLASQFPALLRWTHRFYQGYTSEVLDGQHGTASERLDKIQAAVEKMAKVNQQIQSTQSKSNLRVQGKKVLLIDGVGYPAVGSVVGGALTLLCFMLLYSVLVCTASVVISCVRVVVC